MNNILSKFHIHPTIYLLILIAFLSGYIKPVIIIMSIIIIHELGHVFFAIIFKLNISCIEIYPFGGLTTINKLIHERIYKDLIISLGGITFQLFLHHIYYILYTHNYLHLNTYHLFLKYNYHIILFNILPIIPLDGSKFLNTSLNKIFSFQTSYKLTTIISTITLIIFIIYNTIYKLNDLIIYFFLLIQLFTTIKEYKYINNKFYLERLLYNHYYNQIISNHQDINHLKIDKYYYFYNNKKYINEKDYIKNNYF